MAPPTPCLGIDFGTSNSAAGFVADGQVRLIEFAPGQATLPTTFFFDFDSRETLIGAPANAALLDGREGRFMRALKRVLGTSLMYEKRQILNRRVTFVEIIAGFLQQIKTRAEAETGQRFDRALSGRPVVFHGPDDAREAQAEADLRACYLAAGFTQVDFLPEPQAAAIAGGGQDLQGGIGLVVDIGGGTSDFALFQSRGAGLEILANHGVRLGGTDFDRALSIAQVMPLLGKGTQLRKVLGDGLSPVPNAIFNDLATWEKIPFLYTPQNRRMVAEMVQLAQAPARLARLDTVLTQELGHDLAFATEAGKIAANAQAADAAIALDMVQPGLRADLPPGAMAACLAPQAGQLHQGALDTLARAGLAPDQISHVIYVGGSSLMGMVSDRMRQLFPEARHEYSEVFTAVARGLALEAATR